MERREVGVLRTLGYPNPYGLTTPHGTQHHRTLAAPHHAGQEQRAARSRASSSKSCARRAERGVFDADALSMIEGVLEVADTQVRDIMVPRSQMVVLNQRDDAAEADARRSWSSRATRAFRSSARIATRWSASCSPRTCLRFFAQAERTEEFDIKEFLRPAVVVPESKRVNVLLKEFRVSHNHMAIVVDEYGGVSGLVTIEDVVEQIVGEIDDEYDVEDDSRSGARARAISWFAR